MKALTILQPFAYLIVANIKTVENRTWSTRKRGLTWIHAGKNERYVNDDELMERVCETARVANRIKLTPDELRGRLVYGAVIGRAEITSCAPLEEVIETGSVIDKAWAEGPWCWSLHNPWELRRPIPWRGQQGFFNLDDFPIEIVG